MTECNIWLLSNNSQIENINFKLRVISFHVLESSAYPFVNIISFSTGCQLVLSISVVHASLPPIQMTM